MARLVAVAVIALVAATTLAGCFGGDDESPTPVTTATPPPKGGQSGAGATPAAPGDPGLEPNRAPIANLTADVLTGETPLVVSFTLEASDPDGNPLYWTFDADSDGTKEAEGNELPANVTFTFEEPGNFTASFNVTDLDKVTRTTLAIDVAQGVAKEPPAPKTITGTVNGAYVDNVGYLVSGTNYTFALDVPVSNITVTYEWGATAVDLDFALYAPDGSLAGSRALPNEPTGRVFDAREPPIWVDDPAQTRMTGTWTLRVNAGLSVQGTFTATVTFA